MILESCPSLTARRRHSRGVGVDRYPSSHDRGRPRPARSASAGAGRIAGHRPPLAAPPRRGAVLHRARDRPRRRPSLARPQRGVRRRRTLASHSRSCRRSRRLPAHHAARRRTRHRQALPRRRASRRHRHQGRPVAGVRRRDRRRRHRRLDRRAPTRPLSRLRRVAGCPRGLTMDCRHATRSVQPHRPARGRLRRSSTGMVVYHVLERDRRVAIVQVSFI